MLVSTSLGEVYKLYMLHLRMMSIALLLRFYATMCKKKPMNEWREIGVKTSVRKAILIMRLRNEN